MRERLIVIGGDAGGMSAASQARKRRGPDELEIIAFERGHYTSYSACGIPYYLGGVVEVFDKLIVRTPEDFRQKYSIDARTGHEAIEIDLDKRAVRTVDGGGTETWEGFDRLVVATGGTPKRFDWPGADALGVFGVQVLDDAVAIERYMEEHAPRTAVVVGGGYIGLQMAEAFVNRGLDVTLVEAAPAPMTSLDPDMGGLVADALREMEIRVMTDEPVEGFEVDGERVTAVVTAQGRIPADVVVLGLGTDPNTSLAQAAGIPIGPTGGVKVDRRMETDVDGVYSAGDCAEKFHLVSRLPVAIALGTHANKEGRVAGINLSGGYATFPGVLGTAMAKICGYEVARTGLKEIDAQRAGFRTVTATVDSTTRAGYYPGAEPITTKLIVEQRSGRLLGAQIVGKQGAAKRIDAVATALWNEMTVDEMLNLDLGYAPPFSPLWDPILIAARKAWDAVEGR
ncbi:MAG: FAD-dependent oxidoreductase [Actinomycetota bacterium]|nr:FAD-dependent oxidoreductase [Actinomycetota bacterium]